MVSREEANKIVDAVLDYFRININNMSLTESVNLYNRVYHSVGVK